MRSPMTKSKFTYAEPIPGFDVVKWKREVHAQIQRETEGMTDAEIREYIRQAAERVDNERAAYQAKHCLPTP